MAGRESLASLAYHSCTGLWLGDVLYMHESCGDRIFREYWPALQISLNISRKEMLALIYAQPAAPTIIGNCLVDVAVDGHVVILHLKANVAKLLLS